METLNEKVIAEIRRRIEAIKKEKNGLRWWQVGKKMRCDEALRNYRKLLHQNKKTHVFNLIFGIAEIPLNEEDPMALATVNLLASPSTFDC